MFAVFAPTATAAGAGLLIGLVIAGGKTASCAAMAMTFAAYAAPEPWQKPVRRT